MAVLALDAEIYLNTGSVESPNWQPCDLFENVNLNLAYDTTDTNSRASRVKFKANTQVEVGVTGRLKKKFEDDQYDTIMGALISTNPMDLLVLDGPNDTPGVRGVRGDFQISTGNEDQGLGNALYVDVSFHPADTDNPVQAVHVSGTGSITYGDFGDGTFE